MLLSSQSIRRLCTNERPMITPFVDEKVVVNGKSYGLSSASYDVRIAHDLTLGPNPVHLLAHMAETWPASQWLVPDWAQKLKNYPASKALAYTHEDFNMPHDVSALVCDKSTYARMFVSAMNTFIDAGFTGNLTLELVNLGTEVVEIKAGDPIAQIIFFQMDQPTDRPYAGKFQNQTKAAHGPRYELPDGSWK